MFIIIITKSDSEILAYSFDLLNSVHLTRFRKCSRPVAMTEIRAYIITTVLFVRHLRSVTIVLGRIRFAHLAHRLRIDTVDIAERILNVQLKIQY